MGNKKKILLIGTGGTIVSRPTAEGLVPALSGNDLLRHFTPRENVENIDFNPLLQLDSTNIRPHHWTRIAALIEANYEAYDGFIITHGTDTMAYTAAGLSYLIQNSPKPIVLTGAQKPIWEEETDAKKNINDALLVALDDRSRGVLVVFSGSVIAGTRARKNYTKRFMAFGSVNFPCIAKIKDDRVIYTEEVGNVAASESVECDNVAAMNPAAENPVTNKDIAENAVTAMNAAAENPVTFYHNINENVGLIKLTPGMSDEVLRFAMDTYDGIVVESFGVGGLPEYSDFYHHIERAEEAGKLVVMTTQVPNEGSDLNLYRVGRVLKRELKILEAYDMTSEAVLAKLMWILGQTRDYETAKALFYKPVQHDILK